MLLKGSQFSLLIGPNFLEWKVFSKTMSKKPKTHEFQAETRQVLDIVVNSLYKDKEIFVRELISNASDALEKLRRLQLTEKEVFDDNLELEINVTTDDSANQLTIQDFGVGMTEDELVENLGTMVALGIKEFMGSSPTVRKTRP